MQFVIHLNNSWMKLVWFISFTILLTSCYKDSEESLYPDLNATLCNSDSTTVITYKDQISSTMTYYCLSCHNKSNADKQGKGIKLETFAQVKKEAEKGSLLGSVEHLSKYEPMPKDAGKLSDCKIEEISKWIENGYAE